MHNHEDGKQRIATLKDKHKENQPYNRTTKKHATRNLIDCLKLKQVQIFSYRQEFKWKTNNISKIVNNYRTQRSPKLPNYNGRLKIIAFLYVKQKRVRSRLQNSLGHTPGKKATTKAKQVGLGDSDSKKGQRKSKAPPAQVI